MNETERQVLVVTLVVLGAGAVAYWYYKNHPTSLFDYYTDSVGDQLQLLTTSDTTRIAEMTPDSQDALNQLISDLNDAGITVKVGQTLRTTAQEAAVIQQGKSSIKTHSWHEAGRAVDLYPLLPNGQPDLDGTQIDVFQQMHAIAQSEGWTSLAFNNDGSKHLLTNAYGKQYWDGGHLEWHGPYTNATDAVNALNSLG